MSNNSNGFKNSRAYRTALARLLARDGRPVSKQTRQRGGKRIVTQHSFSDQRYNFWTVSGGQQTHTVDWRNHRWECTTAHYRKDGYMCSHEFAIYRALAVDEIQGVPPK